MSSLSRSKDDYSQRECVCKAFLTRQRALACYQRCSTEANLATGQASHQRVPRIYRRQRMKIERVWHGEGHNLWAKVAIHVAILPMTGPLVDQWPLITAHALLSSPGHHLAHSTQLQQFRPLRPCLGIAQLQAVMQHARNAHPVQVESDARVLVDYER